MKLVFRLLCILLLGTLMFQFLYISAEMAPVELLSNGSAYIDGTIEYYHHQTQTHSITNTTFNRTYSVDDVWSLKDIGKRVVQFTEYLYISEEHSEIDPPIYLILSRTKLIWQENNSWFMTDAGSEYVKSDGSWYFKITLANCRKYEEIIDSYNAEVTFNDSSTAIVKDIYDSMDKSTYEYQIINNFIIWDRYNPLHVPSSLFIISPQSQIGQNITETRKVTEIVEIEINNEVYEAFKVVTNQTFYESEEAYHYYYYEDSYEVRTGLLIAYLHNFTCQVTINIAKFIPTYFYDGTKGVNLDRIFVTAGMATLVVVLCKRKMKQRN
ncbi:MAG: hypothetical protein HGN29_10585 [Asgard group archaeon]|nr:hypothetical protein [Asgard group archaeon]